MKMVKRILAMTLAVAMTVTMLPESALNIYAMQNGGTIGSDSQNYMTVSECTCDGGCNHETVFYDECECDGCVDHCGEGHFCSCDDCSGQADACHDSYDAVSYNFAATGTEATTESDSVSNIEPVAEPGSTNCN